MFTDAHPTPVPKAQIDCPHHQGLARRVCVGLEPPLRPEHVDVIAKHLWQTLHAKRAVRNINAPGNKDAIGQRLAPGRCSLAQLTTKGRVHAEPFIDDGLQVGQLQRFAIPDGSGVVTAPAGKEAVNFGLQLVIRMPCRQEVKQSAPDGRGDGVRPSHELQQHFGFALLLLFVLAGCQMRPARTIGVPTYLRHAFPHEGPEHILPMLDNAICLIVKARRNNVLGHGKQFAPAFGVLFTWPRKEKTPLGEERLPERWDVIHCRDAWHHDFKRFDVTIHV